MCLNLSQVTQEIYFASTTLFVQFSEKKTRKKEKEVVVPAAEQEDKRGKKSKVGKICILWNIFFL